MANYYTVYVKPSCLWTDETLIDKRIDAHFYSIKYMQYYNKLMKCKIKKISLYNICSRMNSGPFGSALLASQYVDKGVAFIRPLNCKDYIVDIDNDVVFISKEDSERLKSSKFSSGDLIFTKIGNIGDVAIIPQKIFECNISGNLMGVKVKNNIDNYYVLTFLKSIYGQNQIWQGMMNSVKPKIDMDTLKSIVIPIPSPEIQKYIGDKVRKAEELREEAKRLKKEVLDRLNTLLFNPNIKIDNNKFLYLDCKEIIDYKIGATIYRPKYVSNRRGLKQGIKLLKLKDISRKIYDGNHGSVHPKNILDEGDIPFIRAQDAHDGLVEINKYISNEEYRLLKHKTINYGDIVYGIKGSVGKGGIYLYENSDATVNPACVVISPKKLVNSGYLIEVLESDYFNNEIYRFAESDSTRPQISRTEFEELEVPMVSEEEQKAIGDLVFRRIKAINQSKQLIQEAKQDVEDLIEGNFDMSKVKANS